MESVAELGEFGLIARLTAGMAARDGVVLGIGDDAAILDVGGEWLVATCDAQVQDVHFRLSTEPEAIGYKALAVNLSDLAAMGARPRFALVSLLLPPEVPLGTLDGLYQGIRMLADQFQVAVVGGNVAANPERLIIDITLLGTSIDHRLLRRTGAKAGDVILVTGHLGTAAAGLLVQEHPDLALGAAERASVLAAQQRPSPRVAAGQWLAHHGATAALDISDGLLADLEHLCQASAVGALVERSALPIRPETRAVAAAVGQDPAEMALTGGEDYELLWTMAPGDAARALRELPEATGLVVTAIGRCVAGAPRITLEGATDTTSPTDGWDHLRSFPRMKEGL